MYNNYVQLKCNIYTFFELNLILIHVGIRYINMKNIRITIKVCQYK